jgi:hypothetical protein
VCSDEKEEDPSFIHARTPSGTAIPVRFKESVVINPGESLEMVSGEVAVIGSGSSAYYRVLSTEPMETKVIDIERKIGLIAKEFTGMPADEHTSLSIVKRVRAVMHEFDIKGSKVVCTIPWLEMNSFERAVWRVINFVDVFGFREGLISAPPVLDADIMHRVEVKVYENLDDDVNDPLLEFGFA